MNFFKGQYFSLRTVLVASFFLAKNTVGHEPAEKPMLSQVRDLPLLEVQKFHEIIIGPGLAKNPGPHPYIEGRGALEHLYEAGGAKIGKYITVKRLERNGKYIAFKINLDGFDEELFDEELVKDMPITPGSVIFIPQRLIDSEVSYSDEYYAENKRKLAVIVRKIREKRAKKKEASLLETK